MPFHVPVAAFPGSCSAMPAWWMQLPAGLDSSRPQVTQRGTALVFQLQLQFSCCQASPALHMARILIQVLPRFLQGLEW